MGVVQVDLQRLEARPDQHVGEDEFAQQEGERQEQRRHQRLAQIGQDHVQEGARGAGAQQVGGVHQVAHVEGSQAVGQRPVHERQGDGEVAAQQYPRCAHQR
ncbi:hypothetical protein D3C80_1831060 [compost metagenome]